MAQNEKMSAVLDLKGLDLVTPVDLLKDGRTPFAKNFRLYAQQEDDRRVAVSSRKGPGFYIDPLSESLSDASPAIVSGSSVEVGPITGIHLERVTAASTGLITKIDVLVGNSRNASGPLMIGIWSDAVNRPSKLLAESSILNGQIAQTLAFQTARFVKAANAVQGQPFWIVYKMQDDGKGTYDLGTSTAGTKAFKTDSSLYGAVEQTYAVPRKVYITPPGAFKGAYRFNRDNGSNITVAAFGTTMYQLNGASWTSIATGLSNLATEYNFDNADNKVFWVNGFDQLKAWNGTTVEAIIDNELPILSDIVFHKDRLWGRTATDPNKLVFSENPGNPSNVATNLQWYYAWLSVSFIYIPRPHNGSPIVGMVSFQDSLQVFTQDSKYVISGYDRGSFNLREATGSKGALSRRGIIADENMIYFVGDDGFYQYNGSQDVKLSGMINPLFDACGQKDKITPALWHNEVRWYMASSGSPVNDTCIIYNKGLKEMQYDTDTYVDRALYYSDADDEGELIEFSSQYPGCWKAEVNYHSMGAPIDFEYRLKYDSMGLPAQKKRLKRFYPILQGTDTAFNIGLSMDKDFEDSPRQTDVMMVGPGARLGQFKLGDGTQLGGDTSFQLKRLTTSGYAYYWQLRIKRKGVDNRVAFIGAQYSYKTKRL